MSDLSRRQFVKHAALTAAALQTLAVSAPTANAAPASPSTRPAADPEDSRQGITLRWLDANAPTLCPGTTWGVPWPRGTFRPDQPFTLTTPTGQPLPLQTWPLAFWPDGSLKWTAHAIPSNMKLDKDLCLTPGKPAAPEAPISVKETDSAIEVATGPLRYHLPRTGSAIIGAITRDNATIATDGRLVCLRQGEPSEAGSVTQEAFTGEIAKVTVEQGGPVRAVVRVEGTHKSKAGRGFLPFTLRLYFYAGADSVRVMHSFIFDGDENKDFIRGLGLRFGVPLRDPLHDRHVRFAGEGQGLWAEGVRNLTGLRRDPGQAVIEKQLAGEACPPVEQFPENVRKRLDLIPAWSDYTLVQNSADAFEIRKRTASEGVCWIRAGHGRRAAGLAYVGDTRGGVAVGLRDFWQRHPTQLDIRGAATDKAEVTVWLWSPEAPAMDLRFYHDGMGMDTHPEQLEGLEITYEDYEPGFGTAHGIARTSEITLWALPSTPPRQRLAEMAGAVQAPPMVTCAPEHLRAAGVFGVWGLPDRSTAAKKRIEDQLDWYLDFYKKEIEQRHWYGFWDYGDVMHTYDKDRHVWRYDVGGYAWDNSELSPDLWLWYAYLRTGRADVFRMAEAMTRHTGEVDVHHIGRFAGLGSRHNVLHWGCSAKQHRISTAVYRRFYYYLTADERVGDLMRELVDSDKTFLTLDPIRKIRKGAYEPAPGALSVGFGTDWGSLASAWLTEWERNPQAECRHKLLNGIRTIGAMKHGFFTTDATYDLATGKFADSGQMNGGVSHLSAVFGLFEVCAELIDLLPEESKGFERAWLQYCELFSAPREEQVKALGVALTGTGLTSAHSRLTAYAAWKKRDRALAERAWREFSADDKRWAPKRYSLQTDKVVGPAVLNPIEEAAWVSTNDTAQWSLAAIQNLALIGESLPKA